MTCKEQLQWLETLEKTIVRVMQGEDASLLAGFQIGLEDVKNTIWMYGDLKDE